MKKLLLGLLPLVLFATPAVLRAQDSDGKAQQLARDLWKASGGENWGKVKAIRFTFVVEDNGNQLARAEHDWDVAAQTDHVKWKDKDITVSVASMPQDEAAKAAFGRWTNDSYWLLAPLKVLDPGVKLSYGGSKEVDGANCETLRVSFAAVGMTPGDQYNFYIDPATKLLKAWDYMPKPDTEMHGSWEKYQEAGGLNLAMEHNFGGKMIRFENVEVKTAQ
ncbi:MAG: hypothetical protein M3032_11200 [Verrucomicrobiota bacterium]|nr:hypothetical protein [Verrucomicrobiota bacterium]